MVEVQEEMGKEGEAMVVVEMVQEEMGREGEAVVVEMAMEGMPEHTHTSHTCTGHQMDICFHICHSYMG